MSPTPPPGVIILDFDPAAAQTAPDPPFPELPPVEREVALALARGLSCAEIAKMRGVSSKTVDTQRANVLKRLGLRNVVGLCRFAIRKGWLQP